jgi:CarD family transcriptional regulator
MFNIGDVIVYPMHGAGVVQSIEEKEVLGETHKYYTLMLPLRNMKVMIPMNNASNMGIRSVIESEGFQDVVEILKAERTEMPDNWNRRYRSNMERLKSGKIDEVSAVVRNLVLLDREKGLSTGEKKMLNNAKQILVSELAYATEYDDAKIGEIIEESIQ